LAQAVKVTVTYTGDGGVVGVWLTNGGAPLLLPLGENAGVWQRADLLWLISTQGIPTNLYGKLSIMATHLTLGATLTTPEVSWLR